MAVEVHEGVGVLGANIAAASIVSTKSFSTL